MEDIWVLLASRDYKEIEDEGIHVREEETILK